MCDAHVAQGQGPGTRPYQSLSASCQQTLLKVYMILTICESAILEIKGKDRASHQHMNLGINVYKY